MIDAETGRLAIGICTRDRPATLRALVGALVPEAAARGVEIIVADSASTIPATAALAEIAVSDAPISIVRLDRPGVSLARNAILNACKADWLAFIDDDEMPYPDWFAAAVALIDRLPARCGACGGNVGPRWPGNPPALTVRARRYLSLIDQAGEFDQTSVPHFGIGHSIVRMTAMRDVGGFNLALGRDGKTLLSGEESDLVDLLAGRGWRIWHSDRIAVDHLIPPDRLDRAWLINRAYWEGISVARRLARTPERLHRLVRAARWRRLALSPMVPIFGTIADVDLRGAFADGVLAEEASATAGAPAAARSGEAGIASA